MTSTVVRDFQTPLSTIFQYSVARLWSDHHSPLTVNVIYGQPQRGNGQKFQRLFYILINWSELMNKQGLTGSQKHFLQNKILICA